jgi:hypothetical protein
MLFIAKLTQKWADAEFAGKTPDVSDYPELAVGDQIVGIIKDPALLAALAITDEQVANFKRTWPVAPEEGSKQYELAVATKSNLEAATAMLLHEVERHFKVTGERLAIRQGYKYPVVVKTAEPKRQFGLPGGMSIADLLGGGAGEDCGDPNCPIHGRQAAGMDLAFLRALSAIRR